MIRERIVEVAQKYIGLHEKPSNSGFEDPLFQKRIEEVGWEKGDAWCAFFAELVWKEAYDNLPMKKQLDKLFSGSAVQTYKNFMLDGKWSMEIKPSAGSLAVWRVGLTDAGHIGIVIKIVDDNTFQTIEGNSNDDGSREGVKVVLKNRRLRAEFKKRGLNLVGFIEPKELIDYEAQ